MACLVEAQLPNMSKCSRQRGQTQYGDAKGVADGRTTGKQRRLTAIVPISRQCQTGNSAERSRIPAILRKTGTSSLSPLGTPSIAAWRTKASYWHCSPARQSNTPTDLETEGEQKSACGRIETSFRSKPCYFKEQQHKER